ncbi:MAG: carotenoid 1,2-hydratase [Acidobacteria bacterium]|nr:carotenoid 1,2-hydratase [Acidobacteriota bacterium]MBV9475703.1 carotenoid 1,2-hydratase [Acidobacteriota bacterium]
MTPARSRRSAVVLFVILHSAFCVLHSSASDFQPALPNYTFDFPTDHGAHPAFRTEWWYYTGHLRTGNGHRYGFELTFFRVGISRAPRETGWDLRDVMPAHFAITDVDGRAFRAYEKMNRASAFTADAAVGKLDVFNEGWRAITNPDGSWRIVASAGRDAIDLTLRSRKAPAIHGENGISIKAPVAGYASHYYSMTRLEVAGVVNGARCTGQAWMDHEFGSSALRENQQGWDWFSIQLDSDAELMLYIIRRKDGTPDVTSSGSLITSDGRVIPLRREQLRVTALRHWTSKRSGATYPMGWRVELPTLNVALVLTPLLESQELLTSGSTHVTYWEGAVDVAGSFDGVAVSGEGYVELTGYDKAFRAP